MVYLALVYRMNIPEEDVKSEAVQLVAPILRDVNVTRPEESFFSKECFLRSDACLQYKPHELKLVRFICYRYIYIYSLI